MGESEVDDQLCFELDVSGALSECQEEKALSADVQIALNPDLMDITVAQPSYNDNKQSDLDETERYTDYYMMGDQLQAQSDDRVSEFFMP